MSAIERALHEHRPVRGVAEIICGCDDWADWFHEFRGSYSDHLADVLDDVLNPRASWEYGVEYRKAYNNFEPTIEWGASTGMSHHYPYTAESVFALAGSNPVWRRLRTSYPDVIEEPEKVDKS